MAIRTVWSHQYLTKFDLAVSFGGLHTFTAKWIIPSNSAIKLGQNEMKYYISIHKQGDQQVKTI